MNCLCFYCNHSICKKLEFVFRTAAVICYYESWAAWDGIIPENFDASLCTHVNYAFITIWDNGNLRVEDDELDINEGLYYRVTDMKKRNSDLKVLLSVNGASATFSSIAADSDKRGAFVGSATYFLSTYGFDGLDIDWEYPENADRTNYITLLRECKEAFQSHGWLLTAAVSSLGDDHGYDYAQMNNYLDIVNVMTYDFYGYGWSSYTGQNSPLFASSAESEWERANLNLAASANAWANSGIPKSKLAIGTGFYGRSFTLQDSNNHGIHAPISGPGWDGGEAPYQTICTSYGGWTRIWDDEQKNPYKISGNQWIGYDDPDSIWAKAAWIKQNGFFGVMIWAIDNDDMTGECGEVQHLLKQINNAY